MIEKSAKTMTAFLICTMLSLHTVVIEAESSESKVAVVHKVAKPMH